MTTSLIQQNNLTDSDNYIKASVYKTNKFKHKNLQNFIYHVLNIGATIFGGYIIFDIKKSHFTKLFYEYCIKTNINYKNNFNNTECHPESILRMSDPFQNKSDIDMYIKAQNLEKLMDYFTSEYDVKVISTSCSYFIPLDIRSKLEFKKLKLIPKMSDTISRTLNGLFGVKIKESLFHHKFIDLIIVKDNSDIQAPFNVPDFKCNQLYIYWDNHKKIISMAHTSYGYIENLSFLDRELFIIENLKKTAQQCIDKVAELCEYNIPHLHRVWKLLNKGYTIKIPPIHIPGYTHHKHKILKEEQTEHKCIICYENFEKDTEILYACNSCSAPYHTECYIMLHIDNVNNYKVQPNCPKCRAKLKEDHCAFINMIFLINNFNNYLITKDINKIIGLRFQYCNYCKEKSPTRKVPNYIKKCTKTDSLKIKYR